MLTYLCICQTCGLLIAVLQVPLYLALPLATHVQMAVIPPTHVQGHGMHVSQGLLVRATVCFARIVASDKLQLSGSTWQVVAECALSPNDQVGLPQ